MTIRKNEKCDSLSGTSVDKMLSIDYGAFMRRALSKFLLWSLILCACSIGTIPSAVPHSPTETTSVVPTTKVPVDPQSCGYQWAYGEAPEAASSFAKSIQALQPEAQVNVYTFGENCVRVDGSVARFLVKETDFEVTLQMDDLSNESNLGGWIVKVMEIIQNIPPEQIRGTGPGQVSIVFQSGTGQDTIRFYANQYQALPSGLSNAEIYQTLKTQH
jgi:hypothetical protein